MKRTLLTFTVVPAFKGGFVISLLEDRGRKSKAYILSCQESSLPFSSFEKPMFSPGDLLTEHEISDEEAEGILAMLKAASVSAMPSYILGLDGTMYLLDVRSGLNEVRYRWWVRIPEGWEPIGEVCNALMQLAGKEALS